MKRIILAADFHCGNRVGLTPPAWQDSPELGPTAFRKFAKFQREVWSFYSSTLQDLKPIDYFFFLGDAVDGKNERSGGTELITADRKVQADMAATCIREAEAKKVYMVYGTPYHSGVEEDWEDIVAEQVGAEISGREWVEVEDFMFDLAHFVGSSAVPHTRGTALSRDMLWNLIWSVDDGQPLADLVVRAHVHYYRYIEEDGRAGMILPALQGYGSKFGVRRCRGKINIGFVSVDVHEGRIQRETHLLQSPLLQIAPKRPS